MTDKITTHHINECNKHISVVRHHEGQTYVLAPPSGKLTRLFFQSGPVGENGQGINGITNEALLAVVVDRLEHFQRGPYACRENERAIEFLGEALGCLEDRAMRVDGPTRADVGPMRYENTCDDPRASQGPAPHLLKGEDLEKYLDGLGIVRGSDESALAKVQLASYAAMAAGNVEEGNRLHREFMNLRLTQQVARENEAPAAALRAEAERAAREAADTDPAPAAELSADAVVPPRERDELDGEIERKLDAEIARQKAELAPRRPTETKKWPGQLATTSKKKDKE